MKLIFIPYFFCIFLSVIVILIYCINTGYNIEILGNAQIVYTNNEYQWPLIGYNYISSYFGKRVAPTTGASTYHSGIDIPAPPGTNIVSCISGKVVFAKFSGAGGNTVIVENGNMQAIYCHVDGNYFPKVGSYVQKGQFIAKVGPKNIYNVSNNPYKDSNGNPTNGATTGPHLHFGIKINGQNVNPLDYVSSI